jgi:hypothetical protein
MRFAAANMTVKRWIAVAGLIGLGPLIGSCGGGSESGFSGYVADHWPHWAGGMPEDVPPRPGAPGYNEFIAHGQADQAAAKPPPSAAEKPVASATTTTNAQPAPAVQVAPADNNPSEDSSAVKGGLY